MPITIVTPQQLKAVADSMGDIINALENGHKTPFFEVVDKIATAKDRRESVLFSAGVLERSGACVNDYQEERRALLNAWGALMPMFDNDNALVKAYEKEIEAVRIAMGRI